MVQKTEYGADSLISNSSSISYQLCILQQLFRFPCFSFFICKLGIIVPIHRIVGRTKGIVQSLDQCLHIVNTVWMLATIMVCLAGLLPLTNTYIQLKNCIHLITFIYYLLVTKNFRLTVGTSLFFTHISRVSPSPIDNIFFLLENS